MTTFPSDVFWRPAEVDVADTLSARVDVADTLFGSADVSDSLYGRADQQVQ